MQKNNGKIKNVVLYIMLSIIILGGLYLIYLDQIDGVYFNKVLTIVPENVKTDKAVYHPGDYIQVTWSICKNRQLSAFVNFSFINEIIIVVPEIKRNLPVGCYFDKPIFQIKIPDCIHTGDFYLKGTVSYVVNPLNTVIFPVESNHFQIVK
jgi:hypothetical protein